MRTDATSGLAVSQRIFKNTCECYVYGGNLQVKRMQLVYDLYVKFIILQLIF